MVNDKRAQSVGRRKETVARVRVMEGRGQVTVNNKPISEVFRGPVLQRGYQKPFEVTKTLGLFTATVKVEGGGASSWLGATVHGIARALAKVSPEYRTILKQAGLLTRDARSRERRKVGLGGRARAKKQSPKR